MLPVRMTTIAVLMAMLQGQSSIGGTLTPTPPVVRSATGTLNAKVVIVEELVPYPVAYVDFDVIGPDAGTVQLVRTNGEGQIDLDLQPGRYAFVSRSPLSFHGQNYSWSTSFDIDREKKTALTLTHTDALIEKIAQKSSTNRLSPESRIYQKYQRSVVTVECDSGSGSGFVIDRDRGLLLTTFQVAGASNYLSVRFSRGNHYEAKFVAGDPSSDIALIRINPDLLKDIPEIPLAPDSDRVGMEGERVVAMGSPIHQQTTITQGILSKVERDALISDVSLSKGTAGGPIMNLDGVAIGIAAYGDASKPGGPGASSIISVRKADRLLSSTKKLSGSSVPSASRLPDNSPVTIPADMLERVSLNIRGGEPFLKTPKNFRTYIKSPFDAHMNVARYKDFLKQKIARRYQGKIPADQETELGPLNFWNRYVGNQFEPVVSIEVVPWPQETSTNIIGKVINGVSSASRVGNLKIKGRMEMRDDFTRMTLYRDGAVVTPILRKRIRDTEIYDTRDMVMRDTALAGFYTYDPREFEPGAKLELHVWKNNEPKPTIIKIPKDYQQRITKQFSEWVQLRR